MVETASTARSSLHPEALTLDDLRPGLRFQRFQRFQPANGGDRPIGRVITVAGEPSEVGHMSGNRFLVIPVRYESDDETKTEPAQVFLADCGIVPVDPQDPNSWSSKYYSLQVVD